MAYYTTDGVEIVPGLKVWNNDLKHCTVKKDTPAPPVGST